MRFGKYKQISLDGVTFFDSRLQTYLKKEYDLLCNEFEEIKKQEIIWFNLRLKNREEHVSSIQKIQKYHENNCTTEAKLKIVGKFDLPIFVIKKILSYNIESVCFHDWEIKDFECDIENIDIMIDKGYKPYIEMKIQISERQYELLLGQTKTPKQIEEQPTSDTSGTGGGQGYPEVGKWESGVTRGTANQIGVTKWSDIVGSTLKRGKSNPLK